MTCLRQNDNLNPLVVPPPPVLTISGCCAARRLRLLLQAMMQIAMKMMTPADAPTDTPICIEPLLPPLSGSSLSEHSKNMAMLYFCGLLFIPQLASFVGKSVKVGRSADQGVLYI